MNLGNGSRGKRCTGVEKLRNLRGRKGPSNGTLMRTRGGRHGDWSLAPVIDWNTRPIDIIQTKENVCEGEKSSGHSLCVPPGQRLEG